MKTVLDPSIPEDKLILGTILRPLISSFTSDGRRAIPGGQLWDALDDVRRHLEHRYLDRSGKDGEAGVLARLAARLLGGSARWVPMGAEDYARLDGRREAMRDLLNEVADLVYGAIQAEAEAAEQARQPRRTNPHVRPPGSSPMGIN